MANHCLVDRICVADACGNNAGLRGGILVEFLQFHELHRRHGRRWGRCETAAHDLGLRTIAGEHPGSHPCRCSPVRCHGICRHRNRLCLARRSDLGGSQMRHTVHGNPIVNALCLLLRNGVDACRGIVSDPLGIRSQLACPVLAHCALARSPAELPADGRLAAASRGSSNDADHLYDLLVAGA